jgi:4-hydroxythreonine-4-phosphate dehydrogenase
MMNKATGKEKIKIGITIGDFNGVGPELILKTFDDLEILNSFIPVIYGSARVFSFYKKSVTAENFVYHAIKSADEAQAGKINLINVWQEEAKIEPGVSNETGAKYAVLSLEAATADLLSGKINALVTSPIDKSHLEKVNFSFPGHTEYFANKAGKESIMLLVHENLRVALVTGHVGINKISGSLSKELITKKAQLLKETLIKDFSISRPKIAVLALNPHAGDQGKFGTEEIEIIKPSIEFLQDKGVLVMGPFSADGFFASGNFKNYDGILAMYHDQGLIPFKTLAGIGGVNFTAGLGFIRTSPDHGPGFDLAGKDQADPTSFRDALYLAADLYLTRTNNKEYSKNPLKTLSGDLLKAQDEPFIEDKE